MTLEQLVDNTVYVYNTAAYEQLDGKIGFSVRGVLEAEVDGEWYVRTCETPQGPMGVSFTSEYVKHIDGARIVLK